MSISFTGEPAIQIFGRRFALYPGGFLLLLIAIGAYLRLKNLDFQSLWIDELVTMLTADPANSTDEMLSYLKRGNDPHPPLYHFLMHAWFKIGGYTEYGARLPSALAGIIAIPVIYFLGKELYNRHAGLFAATFTTFNYYNIVYSQEARNYTFAFLFTVLSFLFLVRALRNTNWRTVLLYTIATTCLLYTHYYGLIILFSQSFIVFLFLFSGRPWKRLVLYFGAGLVLIFLFYLPWLKNAIALAAKTQSFWIERPSSDFFFYYFKEYFGQDALSYAIFAVLLIAFLFAAFQQWSADRIDRETYTFCFIVLISWIALSYLAPYVKSLVSVPLLFSRYTIVTLPAILLTAAIGLELFRYTIVKVAIVCFLVVASLIHLFAAREYYAKPEKQQWREVTRYLIQNSPRRRTNHLGSSLASPLLFSSISCTTTVCHHGPDRFSFRGVGDDGPSRSTTD